MVVLAMTGPSLRGTKQSIPTVPSFQPGEMPWMASRVKFTNASLPAGRQGGIHPRGRVSLRTFSAKSTKSIQDNKTRYRLYSSLYSLHPAQTVVVPKPHFCFSSYGAQLYSLYFVLCLLYSVTLQYNSYDYSHRTHGDEDIPRCDEIVCEISLFIEELYCQEETRDEPEIVADEKCSGRISVVEVFTKCRNICRNDKDDWECVEKIVLCFHRIDRFRLEIRYPHPHGTQDGGVIPDIADDHRDDSSREICCPRDIGDDVKNICKDFHRRGLYLPV